MNLGDVRVAVENDTHAFACGERPQVRLEMFGVSALSDTELVAAILQGNGTGPEQAVAEASRIVAEAGSINGLASWQPADYRRLKGIGRVKALRLAACTEVGRRMMNSTASSNTVYDRPAVVAALFGPITAGLQIEKFWTLCLNRKSRLMKLVQVTSGTASSTLAHPREVFREAIRYAASAVICVHNHPSGDPAPSSQDVQITRLLRDASKAIDIALIDHVVCGHPASDPLGVGYYSFREAGLL